MCARYFGCFGLVTSTIEVPLDSVFPVTVLISRAAVMADVGDEAFALLVHERLVGAAALEVAVADQLHVALLGGWLLLRGYARMPRECDRRQPDRRKSRTHNPHIGLRVGRILHRSLGSSKGVRACPLSGRPSWLQRRLPRRHETRRRSARLRRGGFGERVAETETFDLHVAQLDRRAPVQPR